MEAEWLIYCCLRFAVLSLLEYNLGPSDMEIDCY